ncbi:MAG: hypothetical protein HY706_01240 [Candidatus Hydrogenedentes bacterium]|nr:hypothetical protein [Candidatus Hydrogenedentota bacterium]
MRSSRAWFAAATLCGVATLGCSSAPKEDLLKRADELTRDTRYSEAIPVVKRHLLEFPADPGGHFLLGLCYLHGYHPVTKRPEPWIMIAKGEFETALDCFRANGKRSTIERFNDQYFELRCYLEISKIGIKQIDYLLKNPGAMAPDELHGILRPIVRSCRKACAEAKRVAPDSPDVKWIDENIIPSLDALEAQIRQEPVRQEATTPVA